MAVSLEILKMYQCLGDFVFYLVPPGNPLNPLNPLFYHPEKNPCGFCGGDSGLNLKF